MPNDPLFREPLSTGFWVSFARPSAAARRDGNGDDGRGPRGAADLAYGGATAAVDRLVELGRQRGDGWRLENRADRQLAVEAVADARDQLRRQQRMAAEVEEVVAHADALDVQQVDPDIGKHPLDAIARRDVSVSRPVARCIRRG